MPTNNRIFYAAQSVAVKGSDGTTVFRTGHLVKGAQSVGMTTNINLEPVFTLGRIGLYENVEGLPDVEVTISKVLDGYPTPYLLATTGSETTNPTLAGRSSARCDIAVGIYPDTNSVASGGLTAICMNSGLFPNSISYSFNSEGAFTEETSFVGNDKIWVTGNGSSAALNTVPAFGASDLNISPTITYQAYTSPSLRPLAVVGTARSQDFIFDLPTDTGILAGITLDSNGAVDYADVSVLPPEIAGITLSGINPRSNGESFDVSINSITASVSLNRENINQLGRRGPYARIVSFPVEVSCEISTTSRLGDLVSVTERGIFGTGVGACSADLSNVKARTIRLATCEGLRIYLGRNNKLQSVNHQGGDAGGGNVTNTYTFNTYDDFVVMHQNDSHPSGTNWWTNRDTNGYLVE